LALLAGTAAAQDDAAAPAAVEPRASAVAPDRRTPVLRWQWREFQTWEYAATGGLAAATFGAFFIPVGTGRWTGTNRFDSEVGDAVRPSSRVARQRANDASDLLLALGLNHLLFDSAVVAWGVRGQGGVAYQMVMVDAEALALTMAVTTIVKGGFARERPYGADCPSNPSLARTSECQGTERYKSFISGHTSTSFTVAGLTCMHHAHLPLYGGGLPDALGCAASFAAAGTVGALRVISDDHHPSDVLVGAAVGTASGLGLPWLLHYRHRRSPAAAERSATALSVRLVPAATGGALVGEF
jgi:membrane-associated phospholipid phosphatase